MIKASINRIEKGDNYNGCIVDVAITRLDNQNLLDKKKTMTMYWIFFFFKKPASGNELRYAELIY